MSTPGFSTDEPKYYDPAEVEAYVHDVSTTIKQLQARLAEAIRRAEVAEQALAGNQPETTSLGRALLLTSEVADKTIAEADARRDEIVAAANEEARSLVAAARTEASRLVDAAQEAAADFFRNGEARFLATVRPLAEHTKLMSEQLARVEEEVVSWRTAGATPPASQEPTHWAPRVESPEPHSADQTGPPREIVDGRPGQGSSTLLEDQDLSMRVIPFFPSARPPAAAGDKPVGRPA